MGIGDWGLGNPQSPIPNPQFLFNFIIEKIIYRELLYYYIN